MRRHRRRCPAGYRPHLARADQPPAERDENPDQDDPDQVEVLGDSAYGSGDMLERL